MVAGNSIEHEQTDPHSEGNDAPQETEIESLQQNENEG
jgi:hypothetical protein